MSHNNWIFTKEEILNSPSIRDGIPENEEKEALYNSCKFIQALCKELDIQPFVAVTASVYLRRFFMLQSLKVHDRDVIAQGCVLLASKVDENVKPPGMLVVKAYKLLNPSESSPNTYGPFYEIKKMNVLVAERLILNTLSFDLVVDQPYQYILEFKKSFQEITDAIYQINDNVTQYAWIFANELCLTNLCLLYNSRTLAAWCIYSALCTIGGVDDLDDIVFTYLHENKDDILCI
ncbi:hypothetical protein WA158_001219 [Blastocystis sp. Blastoise]